jgi:TPR repeat protein
METPIWESKMVSLRWQVGLAVLAAALVLSGCAGVVDSVKSGMSHTANYFKAGAAETEGDAAYQRKDYPAALAAYRTAAEAGGAHGQFMLANMYLAGEGVKRSPKQYLHWMQASADNGYPQANYLMGMAYLPCNPGRAEAYLKTAADGEHGAAMHLLGLMYASGTGVEQSDREALRWFRLARAQGIPVEERFLSESGVRAYAAQLERQADQNRRAAQARRKMVREIQQRLTDLGYTPGPVDGLFGGKTQAAIEAFQRDRRLAPDGRATQELLEALRRSL